MKLAIVGTGMIVNEGALPALKEVPEIEKIAIFACPKSRDKAEKIAYELKSKCKADINVEEIKDQVGGGTAPDVYLDGYAVSIIKKDKAAEKIRYDCCSCDAVNCAAKDNYEE